MPSPQIQTTTSSSGTSSTQQVNEIPTRSFSDIRGGLDLEWNRPIGSLFSVTTGGHLSRERDYSSLGASGRVSLELMHRLTTVSAGGGVDDDQVFPKGGTRAPLTDGSVLIGNEPNQKRVVTRTAGVSQVLTRRLMASVDASETEESGYLTEPYKVVSVLDPSTGLPSSQLTEKRPRTRHRRSVLTSSVYHLTNDVLYLSHRYYWDDWGVRSNTLDARYRTELPEHQWVQPHVRLYEQSAARFFGFGLVQGDPLPDFATSDYRLGALRSVTLGATYGFRVPDFPGELTLRAEYIHEWGNGHPATAIGAQRDMDLFPGLDIATIMFGYTRQF
jgi:hypothetical protein